MNDDINDDMQSDWADEMDALESSPIDDHPEWYAVAKQADALGLTFKRGKTATETFAHQAGSLKDATDADLLAGVARGAKAEAARKRAYDNLVELDPYKVDAATMARAMDVGATFADFTAAYIEDAVANGPQGRSMADYLQEHTLRTAMWVGYYDARDEEIEARGIIG